MSATVLSVENLSKRYGGLQATRNVSLDVRAGEIHALIGPNGAGKTTLIAQICGDVAPDAGAVRLRGEDVTRLEASARVRRGLARSFQITQLPDALTVRETAMLAVASATGGAWSFVRPARADGALVERAQAELDAAGLGGRADMTNAALSHGERKQLELALALAARPQLLLLDEPMAGLGSSESEAMVARVAALKGGPAILLVEHDMAAVFRLADRVTVLAEGAVLATGAPDAVRADPAVRRVYLGS